MDPLLWNDWELIPEFTFSMDPFFYKISMDLRRAMIRVQGETFRKSLTGDHFTNGSERFISMDLLWNDCCEMIRVQEE